MADRLLVGPARAVRDRATGGAWDVGDVQFLGDPVTAVLRTGRDLRAWIWAFRAKLWRRVGMVPGGTPAPTFPPKPRMPAMIRILGRWPDWAIEPGGVPPAVGRTCGRIVPVR